MSPLKLDESGGGGARGLSPTSLQTARDQEIVRFIGRVGGPSAEHVEERFGSESRAYARLRLLVKDGLLEHKQLLHRVPGLYVGTREGLRWAGLGPLSVQRISAGGADKALSGERFHRAPLPRDQTLGNLSTVIAHRQNVPASTQLIAAMAGMTPRWRSTQQTTDRFFGAAHSGSARAGAITSC